MMFIMSMTSISVWAQVQVPIVWPFNPGSNQANFIRAMIEEANASQTKYLFVFDNKPGAGGSIAANTVAKSDRLAILSSPSSFFTRPLFYPNESHDINQFRPIMTQCSGLPYVIVSSKFKNMEELKKQSTLTIGVILGHPTEAVARELKKHLPNTQLTIVGYNATTPGTLDVISGNLDLNVDLPAGAKSWFDQKRINILGSTGTKDYPEFVSFASQNIRGFESYSADYRLLVSKSVPEEQVIELHSILKKANQADRVRQLQRSDYCTPSNLSLQKTQEDHGREVKYWQRVIKQ